METAEVLRKIKGICKKYKTCTDCPLDRVFCEVNPEHWIDSEIEYMAKIINSYEEEGEINV